jgi:hypothetical protein
LRGVHVRAVYVPDDTPVRWPYPAVLHFTLPAGGHFAVLLPGTDKGESVLWSSGSITPVAAGACLAGRTALVLLTAPHAITDADLKPLTSRRPVLYALAVALPFLPVVALLLLYRLPFVRLRIFGKGVEPC